MKGKIFKQVNILFIAFCVILFYSIPTYAMELENENTLFQTIEDALSIEDETVIENDITMEDETFIENDLSMEIESTIVETQENNEELTNSNNNTSIETTNENNIEDTNTYLVEDFVGKNYKEVEKILNDNNITPIINFEESSIYPIDIVISQNISPNSTINETSEFILVVSNGTSINDGNTIDIESEVNTKQTNSFGLSNSSGGTNIVIDGNYDDWADKPCSYEYNWDNSENCWYYGVWVNGECYMTPEGTYDTNVRHLMQLHSDGEYVYLHIIFSRDYGAYQNGNDYQFTINGQTANFQVETQAGEGIANKLFPVGTHELVVAHRDDDISYSQAINSKVYLTVHNEENINNELELKIPISEMKNQNPNIDVTNIGVIEYFCPNLMYNRITNAGTSTGAIIFAIMSLSVFSLVFLKKKKVKNKE